MTLTPRLRLLAYAGILGALLLVTVAAMTLIPVALAHAATPDGEAPAAISIAFAPSWIQLLTLAVTIVSPLLVGLVTQRVTSSRTKAILLAAIAAVTGLGSELLTAITEGQTYDLAAGLYLALGSFAIAVGLHLGLYKPTGATAAAQSVGAPGRHE